MDNKIDLTDVTFLIPLRIDSLERLENIIAVTSYLKKHFKTNIFICEADKENSGLLQAIINPDIKVYFVQDSKYSFHRTFYINELVRVCTTPFVAIWDADVVTDPQQIIVAVNSLRQNIYDFIYPYNGKFLDTSVQHRRLFIEQLTIEILKKNAHFMKTPYTSQACGGGFLVNKMSYLRAGMENERFSSWGPEDGERLKRWRTLEMRIGWVNGEMFHLTHSRGVNSRYNSDMERIKLIAEADRMGSMSKEELEEEVKLWNRKIELRKPLLLG